jgi:hypothetical protein
MLIEAAMKSGTAGGMCSASIKRITNTFVTKTIFNSCLLQFDESLAVPLE